MLLKCHVLFIPYQHPRPHWNWLNFLRMGKKKFSVFPRLYLRVTVNSTLPWDSQELGEEKRISCYRWVVSERNKAGSEFRAFNGTWALVALKLKGEGSTEKKLITKVCLTESAWAVEVSTAFPISLRCHWCLSRQQLATTVKRNS